MILYEDRYYHNQLSSWGFYVHGMQKLSVDAIQVVDRYSQVYIYHDLGANLKDPINLEAASKRRVSYWFLQFIRMSGYCTDRRAYRH